MKEKEKKNLPLAGKIFIGLALGIVAGVIFMVTGKEEWATNYIKPFGTIFLNLLKMIVVPIVLTSIISGIVSLKDVSKIGSIGLKTVVYYIITTACAIVIGLLGANLFKSTFTVLSTSDLSYTAAETTSFMDTIVNIFPSNIIHPMAETTMLQIIVIALFIGVAMIMTGEKAKPMIQLNNSMSEVFMTIMGIIIKTSPVAVFCLITPVIATNGPQVLGSLAKVLAAAYICYIVHTVVVYSTMVRTLGNCSPIKFFKAMLPAMIFACSSTSSVGTLPINMKSVEELGVKKEVSSFILPLGATINMDGTAIYQGVCAIFIASCYGITLTMPQMITIVLTATLASVGTAGTPGAGMVMLTMVLQSVGLPIEGIALVAGIDRIFDMGRTAVNIVGDASCAVVVDNLERKKEEKRNHAK